MVDAVQEQTPKRIFLVAAKAGSILAQLPSGQIAPGGNTMLHTSESLRVFVERAIMAVIKQDVRAVSILRNVADAVAEWMRDAELGEMADLDNLHASIVRLPDDYTQEKIVHIRGDQVAPKLAIATA